MELPPAIQSEQMQEPELPPPPVPPKMLNFTDSNVISSTNMMESAAPLVPPKDAYPHSDLP